MIHSLVRTRNVILLYCLEKHLNYLGAHQGKYTIDFFAFWILVSLPLLNCKCVKLLNKIDIIRCQTWMNAWYKAVFLMLNQVQIQNHFWRKVFII